ncbi:MAG: hypothetical protein IJ155_04040 [Prevotella sp.]|nr:hypothetical protein [Prevotella sp.]
MKRYIMPQIEVIKIETAQMIALSGTLDSTQSITNSDDFGARESDFDDE